MVVDPCKEKLDRYRNAIKEYNDQRRGAQQNVISEPLEPENLPPALEGSLPDDPYRREKEAKEQLDQAEKAYRDCIAKAG